MSLGVENEKGKENFLVSNSQKSSIERNIERKVIIYFPLEMS